MLEWNDCAIFLKCSFEVNIHPSLQVGHKGVHMTLPPYRKVFMLTSSGLGMRSNLKCLALSLPIRMDEVY
jgi:hypothetical protein